ncbi:hypothetical protein GQ457_08G033810 [Hibiscus cannabinus]
MSFRRAGVAVFVNHVSKRIHHSTLKEAFAVYGAVTDVYIAYNSLKRLHRGDTFAFIRYETGEEARRAIELGNGRRMDGFIIRCFMGRRSSEPQIDTRSRMAKQVSSAPRIARECSKMTEGRSYREALFSHDSRSEEKGKESNGTGFDLGNKPGACSTVNDCNLFHFTVQQNDMLWINKCIVGQIKGMYDADFIQQILRSDGFKVKVSAWSGFYSIIQFEEEEQIQIFKDLKEEMLKNWFDDLETLENFSLNLKHKIWVSLENVPLVAWNNGIFSALANKWGKLIKIDKDTALKNRFDCARLLIGVKQRADVPHSITLFINGQAYCVKVSISDYEDERVWISDGCLTNPSVESPGAQWVDIDRCRGDGIDSIHYDEMLETTNKIDMVDNSGAGDVLESEKSPSGFATRDVLNAVGTNLQEQIPTWSTEEVGLHEVPITEATDSNSSSRLSVSLEPVYDSVSGLFSVKPKYIKQGKTRGPFTFCSKLDRLQNWVSHDVSKQKSSIRSRGKTKLPDDKEGAMGSKDEEGDVSSSHFNGRSRSTLRHSEKEILEAKKTLEVCKVLGIKFNADNEVILNRFVDMEKSLEG